MTCCSTPPARSSIVPLVNTSTIASFHVGCDGRLIAAPGSPFAAQGPGPFGSEFRPTNPSQLFVSNAHGGEGNGTVSAFNVSFSGELTSIGSSPFADLQTAPCWVEISHDGQFLFTVNTGSGEISSYAINPDGSLVLLGSTPFGSAGAGAVDARLSPDGRTLLVNGSKADVVASFAVNGGRPHRAPELAHAAARGRRRLGHRRRLTSADRRRPGQHPPGRRRPRRSRSPRVVGRAFSMHRTSSCYGVVAASAVLLHRRARVSAKPPLITMTLQGRYLSVGQEQLVHPLQWLGQRDRDLAALRRAGRAAIVMPAMFALGDKVIGNPAVATFAAFGSFAMLLLVDFGGPVRDRLRAQTALAIVGCVFVCVGTLVSQNVWLAAAMMAVVGFVVIFAGVVSSVLAGAHHLTAARLHLAGDARRRALIGAGPGGGLGDGRGRPRWSRSYCSGRRRHATRCAQRPSAPAGHWRHGCVRRSRT